VTNPSTALARAVVDALLQHGVTDLVAAPGSRNAPLLFAAYDAEAAGLLRLHTRMDERTAGFLALGLAKVTHRRAAVVCTSGTAVANLHPAMLEAAHAGVPLVAVTADRPARFRGTNANQTTDQVGVFGPMVPLHDLSGVSRGMRNADDPGTPTGPSLPDLLALDGPLHVNVSFDEPLVPGDRWEPVPPARVDHGDGRGFMRPTGPVSMLPLGPRTVVVAGDDAGPLARVLAEAADWPLLAEPSSGSRTGTHAIRCYRLVLAGELGEQVERVVVVGHPTLSRPVTRLLARSDVEVWSVPTAGAWSERPFEVDQVVENPAVEDRDDPAWLAAWREADAAASSGLDALLSAEGRLTPHAVAGAVARALPAGGLLVVGASNPLRDLDLMVPRYEVGGRRKVIANRGLSGIDGTISTAIGAALGRSSSRALALMGDVTFLHDANGLVLGPDEPRPDLTVVVVNDDGGSIFSLLEQGDPAYADRFERLFGTPHAVDLGALCAATRTPHWRVDSLAELEHALANPNGGIEVVEAVVRRDDRRAFDERIRGLAQA
jgi:2-succinyl-5-enolpyruvyl-6-hydroxy-3-cyclohexene-1-carboxylate synthase